MKIQKPTEYDQIKGMLNKIRNLNESKKNTSNFILEQGDPSSTMGSEENSSDNQVDVDATKEQYDNIEVINDVEVKLLSSDKEDIELKPDEKDAISQMIDSFRLEVSQISELDPGFTISEKQLRLDGNANEMDINFTFIAGEDMGLYVTSEMALVDEGVLEFMTKLGKFYKTFITAMEPLIRDRKTT
jgi:hypothetical protein